MTIKKMLTFNTDFKNKFKASATLHQGINCGGTNPAKCNNKLKSDINEFFWLVGSRLT